MTPKPAIPVLRAGPVPYSRYDEMTRQCAECGATFTTRSRTKLFCLSAHKLAFHNRCTARGKVLVPLAMAWRTKRGTGDTAKLAFLKMNAALDRYAAEDREAKRMPMADYVERGFLQWHRR